MGTKSYRWSAVGSTRTSCPALGAHKTYVSQASNCNYTAVLTDFRGKGGVPISALAAFTAAMTPGDGTPNDSP